MINKSALQKKRKDFDVPTRMIGSFTDEMEGVAESIKDQITGDKPPDQPDPIAESMRQGLEDEEAKKDNKPSSERKFIKTREELESELRKMQSVSQQKLKDWKEGVDEQLKIVDPGEHLKKDDVIPLTTKPKRGMMPGMPGTAKGGSGMEVVKSKQ